MGERGMISRKALSVLLSFWIIISALLFAGITAFAEENDDTEYTQLDMPIISSVSSTAEGVKISWKAVVGAEWYRVFYKNSAGNWVRIDLTNETSYIWAGAKSGTEYTFTVRCTNEDGTEYISPYDQDGKSIDYIAAPKITSVSNVATGVQIKWKASAGAENYRVFYKNSAGNWVRIGDTTDTSYIWTGAKSGTEYTFTVRCTNEDGTEYISPYDPDGKSFYYIAAPKITSVSNVATGVQIKWKASAGAENYRVFYKNSAGNWVRIGDTTDTSFIWTKAKSGTKYDFTVRCITKDGAKYTSSYDPTGLSLDYVAAPKISLATKANSIEIKWNKVNGASSYRVFYKTASGTWKKVADTASTSYTYKGSKSGQKYTFTVRCLGKDGKTYVSSYDPDGQTVKIVSAPKLSSVSTVAKGIKISWGKVSGAEKYRVFYKTGNSGWTKIADTTGTSYTWTGATGGKKYTFTVRCINKDGRSYASTYDSKGKSFSYVAAPKISSASYSSSGVEIKWNKPSGAAKFRVYYKNGSGWTKIAETSSTSYKWKGAKTGKTYTFTVRCVSSDSNTFTSGYDTNGYKISYRSTPKLSSVSADNNGIVLKWNKVSGAEKYRVFYKNSSGGWTKIANTTDTSYTWTGAKTGTNYTFTVRCITSDGKSYTSDYDSAGKSLKYNATPNLSSVSATSDGIVIKWSKVSGAEKYKVFRKVAGGSWTAIGVTAYTNFTDMQAEKGVSYTYTVRCMNKNASVYTSGYDTKGKTAVSVSTPPKKNDMVATAEKELGYTGGKKVWTWAGYKSRVPWCNLFVTWCANQLGYYQSGRIPLIQWPRDSVVWFKDKGLFKSPSYIPKPGDLVYFIQPGAAQPYHIGIIEKYENGKIYTIEGNSGDVVKRRSFAHSDSLIYGYATPDYGHN